MVVYDARPSTFTQLTTTTDWENLLSAGAFRDAPDGPNAFAPSFDVPGRNIVIALGNAAIRGQLWRCDAPVSTAIPAASGQNRIDRLVLRLTRGASTSSTVVVPTVIAGTPSGSPAMPPLVQTPTGIWDLPICSWTSTSAGALSSLVDQRRCSNDTWHDLRPLTNSFLGTVSGFVPPQFRFSDDGEFVDIAGYVQTPPTTGNYNNLSFATVPAQYRPVVTPVGWFITSVADGSATPVCQVGVDGTLQFHFMPGSLAQTVIGISGRYALQDTAGFIQV